MRKLPQLIFCVFAKLCSARFVSSKKNTVDFVCVWIFFIVISAAIFAWETVPTKFSIRISHLPVKVSFRHQCEVVESLW